MSIPRTIGALSQAAAAALCAAAAAGCGLGPGEESGRIELTVTRDYGGELMVRGTERTTAADTVLRVLDRLAEIDTRYGGGFVQSIDGVSGGSEDGRRFDWFFFVNGIEAPRGSAEFELRDGDRVWWDHRDWTAAMRAPAVVGSFPEPLVHGFDGEAWPVVVVCLTRRRMCELGREELAGDGVSARMVARPGEAGEGSLRVLVGPWGRISGDPAAALLAREPGHSGVFARFAGAGDGTRLLLLDQRAEVAGRGAAGWGLVAAVRPGEGPPSWLVTGTDAAGVARAVRALDRETLEDRYAVALPGVGAPVALPRLPGEGA